MKPLPCVELASRTPSWQRSSVGASTDRTYGRKRSDQTYPNTLPAGGRPHMDSRFRGNDDRVESSATCRSLRRLQQRQLQADQQAAAGTVLGADAPAQRLEISARHPQADAAMGLAAGATRLGAQREAALEDPLAVLGRHTGTVIGDPDLRPRAVA